MRALTTPNQRTAAVCGTATAAEAEADAGCPKHFVDFLVTVPADTVAAAVDLTAESNLRKEAADKVAADAAVADAVLMTTAAQLKVDAPTRNLHVLAFTDSDVSATDFSGNAPMKRRLRAAIRRATEDGEDGSVAVRCGAATEEEALACAAEAGAEADSTVTGTTDGDGAALGEQDTSHLDAKTDALGNTAAAGLAPTSLLLAACIAAAAMAMEQ